MDSERNIAAKKTVSRPMQESSLQDNAHNDNVQNVVLQAADSEMVVGMKLPLNCKMIAHPNTLVQETAATTLQDCTIIDVQDGHTSEQETNSFSSGVMVLKGLEIAVIR